MEIFDPRQLINWGNSSKESFLIMRPTRVMRGSRLILNTGPVFSFKVIRRSSCDYSIDVHAAELPHHEAFTILANTLLLEDNGALRVIDFDGNGDEGIEPAEQDKNRRAESDVERALDESVEPALLVDAPRRLVDFWIRWQLLEPILTHIVDEVAMHGLPGGIHHLRPIEINFVQASRTQNFIITLYRDRAARIRRHRH